MTGEIERIAAELPADVVKALTVEGAPIPDSLWFGKYANLRSPTVHGWRLSPLGLRLRAHLEQHHAKD